MRYKSKEIQATDGGVLAGELNADAFQRRPSPKTLATMRLTEPGQIQLNCSVLLYCKGKDVVVCAAFVQRLKRNIPRSFAQCFKLKNPIQHKIQTECHR